MGGLCFLSWRDLTLKICCKHQERIAPLFVVHLLHALVDLAKLPFPPDIVKELPKIEAIIVRGVGLGVIRWRQCCHLMTVHGIVEKETFDLFGDLLRREMIPLMD